MASSSRAAHRSSGPVLQSTFSSTGGGGGGGFHRSTYSSTSRPYNLSSYSTSPYATSTHNFASYSFATTPQHSPSVGGGFFSRSASPTRVNLPQSSSVRVSLDSRSISPSSRQNTNSPVVVRRPGASSHSTTSAAGSRSSHASSASSAATKRRSCMCSPTTHPGSFRCALHKNAPPACSGYASSSNRLHARRSAMTNSLVRIGTVEGDLVKRALAALIRPSSHQQRRRAGFQTRPSRLSAMSKAEDFTSAGPHVATAAAA